MGEPWKGPRKCERCGAITGKDWAGEIEYADGRRYHFTFRGEKKGARPIMCDGEMKPHDRRAPDPRVAARMEALRRYGKHDASCPSAAPGAGRRERGKPP